MKEINTEERIKRLKHSCTLNDNGVERYFHNGYEYVEIGGLKWAKCNVGAEKETDNGLYFQWGDTQGYTSEQVGDGEGQKYFGLKDYKFGCMSHLLKYNSVGGEAVLELEDDAAHFNMGGSWRMPSDAEFRELVENTTIEWTEINGVLGRKFTSKSDKRKYVFFPAVGYCYYGSVFNVGSFGYYWSSSLDMCDVRNACDMLFHSSLAPWHDSNSRYLGFSVRGVIG